MHLRQTYHAVESMQMAAAATVLCMHQVVMSHIETVIFSRCSFYDRIGPHHHQQQPFIGALWA